MLRQLRHSDMNLHITVLVSGVFLHIISVADDGSSVWLFDLLCGYFRVAQ